MSMGPATESQPSKVMASDQEPRRCWQRAMDSAPALTCSHGLLRITFSSEPQFPNLKKGKKNKKNIVAMM